MRCQAVFSKALSFNHLRSPALTFKKSFTPAWALQRGKAPRLQKLQVPSKEPLTHDYWSFGSFWGSVTQKYSTVDALYAALSNRLETIRKIRETARSWIQTTRSLSPLYETLASCSAFSTDSGTYLIDASLLSPIQDGISGSYFLKDKSGQIRFVVKPLDEDIGCIHNPKGFATPFKTSPIRNNMSLYSSAFREAAASQFARTAGISSIAPCTVLAILQSDRFHTLGDDVSLTEIARFKERCGEADREKLCSVQEYIPNSKKLGEALQEFQAAGLLDEEIAARIDASDFEEANLLIWLTYDTDAHAGNFLVYPKRIDAIGNEILGIKKIDNGLAFPEKNQQLRNHLAFLPNASQTLSASLKEKIASLDANRFDELLRYHNLDASAPALAQRIGKLKELASRPGITIRQINSELSQLGHNR